MPEIPLEYEQLSKEVGGFLDNVNGGYLPENLVLADRHGENNGCVLKVSAPLFRCHSVLVQARSCKI